MPERGARLVRWWFHEPARANALAVAATLLLVAGAIAFGIYGRPIDEWARPALSVDLAEEVARWAAEEHVRCGEKARRDEKLLVRDPALLRSELAALLGMLPGAAPDLSSAGYVFVGAGRSLMPGYERSGHILWEKPAAAAGPPPMVSLFVVRDEGQLASMPPRHWHEPANTRGPRRVLLARDGPLLYLLVCCDEGDLAEVARRVLSRG